jgi:hypothetical protein
MTTYYKIRKKSDPTQFVKGTPGYPSYDQTGRIFQKLGPLRSFLTGVMNDTYRTADISDWEIMELEMVVKEVKEVHEVISAKRLTELLTR